MERWGRERKKGSKGRGRRGKEMENWSGEGVDIAWLDL